MISSRPAVPWPVGSPSSHSASASAAATRVRLQLPWPSPVSGSPSASQSEPFDFRWLTTTVTSPPTSRSVNVCARAGRLFAAKSGSTVESSTAKAPTGATSAGL